MAELVSAVLFEKNQRALVVHRRAAPFSGQWLLPLTGVREEEAAEEAMRRHAEEQFGVAQGDQSEEFVETVYMVDAADGRQYVANIFRAALPEGPMRFNAEGDYDDARWLTASELEGLPMPPDLRLPLAKILTEPETLHQLDWEQMGRELSAQAVPLAEREATVETQAAEGPPPDNRGGWNAISRSYQKEFYGERFGDRLRWSWRATEDDLHVLDDVAGKRAVVLGCGGGQDVVALAKMGAIAVGIDQSAAQVEYARRHVLSRAANASVVEGALEDLSRFDDESFDVAISIHALGYVECLDMALAEAARVLKQGGVLAIAVQHPLDVCVDGGPPYVVSQPYWTAVRDWTWEFGDGVSGNFRTHYRTIGEWVDQLACAGFTVERIFEPREADLPKEGDSHDDEWLRLVPYTMILKARKR